MVNEIIADQVQVENIKGIDADKQFKISTKPSQLGLLK